MEIIKIYNENNHKVYNIFGLRMKFRLNANIIGYHIQGKNNKIIVVKGVDEHELKKTEKINGLKIIINGNNNYIKINCDNFAGSFINIHANNTKIIIDKTDRLHNFCISACCGNNQKLYWGENSNTWGAAIYLNEENAICKVGKNCMMSGQISMWATDGHSILDFNTKKLLNFEKFGIIIGDHCWIGEGCHFTKNTILPNNTIVGARSVVTKKFSKENTIIAGNPAKIIRENVTWDRKTAFYYNKENHNLLTDAEMVKNII